MCLLHYCLASVLLLLTLVDENSSTTLLDRSDSKITLLDISNLTHELSVSRLRFGPVAAKESCTDAPNKALREICRQLNGWNRKADLASIGGSSDPSAVHDPTVQDCMSWRCVCERAGGVLGTAGNYCQLNGTWLLLKPSKRQEYRMMSDEARRRFHAALNKLKTEGHFDSMIRQHTNFWASPGAHGGAAFLPWHREFLKRLEITLRLIDWSVSLPYWDSTLDEALPDARDSVLWTEDFLGQTDWSGNVISGPFTQWRPTDGRRSVRRSLGRLGSLFNEKKLKLISERKTYHQLASRQCPSYRDWDSLEVTHGLVHLWVGGHMFDQLTSPNDPTFFLHHGFVDLVWEHWRHRQQTRWQRENDYTPWPCRRAHSPHSPMAPFGPARTNLEGLSNAYTDSLYAYEARPTCSRRTPDCGSRYLFCNTKREPPVCVSKVKRWGNCSAFEGYPICVSGDCVNGQCSGIRTARTTTARARASSTATTPIKTKAPTSTPMTVPPDSGCYNESPCCLSWADYGECRRNAPFMTSSCMASCRKCQPKHVVADNVCADYHPECARRVEMGECQSKSAWMAENCQRSCSLCHLSKMALCRNS